MLRSTLLLSTVLSAPALLAQGTISNGNVTYVVGPISATQSDSVGSQFSANPGVDTNLMFEHWWYYRVAGDTDERAFRNDGTLTQSYAGGHADLDWSNVDGRGLLRANLDLDVVSTGSNSGFVNCAMTLTNISASPVVVNLFTYVDLDICSTSNTAAGPGTVHTVTGSCASETVEFSGTGADHWVVATFSGTECGILNAGTIVLPDSGLPYGPGDYSAALQWRDRTLAPGQSITLVSRLDHNPGACPTRAASVGYGTASGGAGGPPTFTTSALPRQNTNAGLAIGNAVPLTTGSLLFGFPRANVQVGNVTLLLNSFGSVPITTDAGGNGSFQVLVPTSPNLCGAVLDWQYFYIDATVSGTYPIAHTAGVEWTIGG